MVKVIPKKKYNETSTPQEPRGNDIEANKKLAQWCIDYWQSRAEQAGVAMLMQCHADSFSMSYYKRSDVAKKHRYAIVAYYFLNQPSFKAEIREGLISSGLLALKSDHDRRY